MRLVRLRIESFGPAKAGLEAELGEASRVQSLVLPDELDAGLLGEAVGWAIRGRGPEPRESTEVELEWSDGERVLRVRRKGEKGRVEVWSKKAGSGRSSDEPTADDEAGLAACLSEHSIASADAVLADARRSCATFRTSGAWREALAVPRLGALARTIEDRVEHLLVELESRADALRLRRAEALSAAAEHLGAEAASELALEELEDRRREAAFRWEAAQAACSSLADAHETVGSLLETARARQERLEQLEAARRRLREAERAESDRRRWERELERARTAAALAPREDELADRGSVEREAEAARVLRRHESEASAAREAQESASAAAAEAEREGEKRADLRARLAELEDLEGVRAVLLRTRESLTASVQERARLQERRAAAAALLGDLDARREAADGACRRARSALGAEGARRVAELRSELEASEGRLAAARRLAEAQERRREVTKIHATTMIHLDRARRALDAEERQLDRRREQPGASPGAAELNEQADRVTGLRSDVDRLAADQAEQDQAVQDLGSEVLRLRQELGALAYRDPVELERETATLRERLAEAGAPAEALARAEGQLAELLSELESTRRELEEAETALTGARAREESERDLATELETRLPAALREDGALERERQRTSAELERLEAAAEAARASLEGATAVLREASEGLDRARAEHDEAVAVLEKASQRLAAVVLEAGFRDLADFREAKRDEDERESLRRRVEEARGELEAAREAHRELEGLTNVPVLRDSDRSELEREEWERRQRERKERLQAERVHRDRATLEGLRDQLAAAAKDAEQDEQRHREAHAALERVAEATDGFSEQLRALRERHAALSRLADLAGGRRGPAEGFAGELQRAGRVEAAARAGQWSRRLTAGAWHLEVPFDGDGSEPEWREVAGRGRHALPDAPEELRWLAALCLRLSALDASHLAFRSRRPGVVVIDGLPEGLERESVEAVNAWLERLASELGHVLVGTSLRDAPAEALRWTASREAASRQAG